MKAGLNGRFPAAEIIFVGKRAWRRRKKRRTDPIPQRKSPFLPYFFVANEKQNVATILLPPPFFPRRQNKGFFFNVFFLSSAKSLSFPSLRNGFLDREYCTTMRRKFFNNPRPPPHIFQKKVVNMRGGGGRGKFSSLLEPVKLFLEGENKVLHAEIGRGRGPDCLEPSKTLPNPTLTQRFPDTFHFPPLGAHPKQHPLLLL